MKTIAKFLARAAAGAALAVAAMAAHAVTYDFKLTGSYTAHWQLPAMPTPDHSGAGVNFVFFDHPGDFPGSTAGVAHIYFQPLSGYDGGMSLIDYAGGDYHGALMGGDGEQLYTGDESAPTFKLGTFEMVAPFGGPERYTLTISVVPEPASLALMMGGLGLVGVVAARRRRSPG